MLSKLIAVVHKRRTHSPANSNPVRNAAVVSSSIGDSLDPSAVGLASLAVCPPACTVVVPGLPPGELESINAAGPILFGAIATSESLAQICKPSVLGGHALLSCQRQAGRMDCSACKSLPFPT